MGVVLVQWVSPLLTHGNTHFLRFVSSGFIRIFQFILHMALLNPIGVISYSILYTCIRPAMLFFLNVVFADLQLFVIHFIVYLFYSFKDKIWEANLKCVFNIIEISNLCGLIIDIRQTLTLAHIVQTLLIFCLIF